MKTIQVTIAGDAPLMMHNDRLANPMDEYARQLKEYTSKRTKTNEDYEAIARIEFLGGIYYTEDAGVHLPSRNFRKCIEEGAKISKKGTAIKRGVFVVENTLALIYQGPKTPKELYAYRGGAFVDTRTAGNNGSRIVRTRPIFAPPWGFVATLRYEPTQINEADLKRCISDAGEFCGLGDYRPIPSGGSFGKFKIEKWEA